MQTVTQNKKNKFIDQIAIYLIALNNITGKNVKIKNTKTQKHNQTGPGLYINEKIRLTQKVKL